MEHFSSDKAWQLASDLAVYCYRQLEEHDAGQEPNLARQISKFAARVAAQVAEDFGSKVSITGRLHLNMAVTSLRAMESNLLIAFEVGDVTDEIRSTITAKTRALEEELRQRQKVAKEERRAKMARRMTSSMGLDMDDDD